MRWIGWCKRASPWALALTLLGLQWVLGSGSAWQFDRHSWELGAWWQPFSAQWVHLNGLHAVWNAVALTVAVLVFSRWITWTWQCLAFLGGYLAVAGVLVLDTQCAYYAGASGAVYGLLSGAGLACWLQLRSRLAVLFLAFLLLKLLLQTLVVYPGFAHGRDIAVYVPSHWAGALGGLLLVALAAAAQRVRRSA